MLKFAVFWAAVAAVPVLAAVLAVNRRWSRWAFYGMVAGLCLYQETAINFCSHEKYSGTSRGVEVSLVHLLAAAISGGLLLRGKWQKLFPDGGTRIYAVYLLLCLPGIWGADSALFAWFEVWKMLLLFGIWHSTYGYLRASDDVEGLVRVLAVFAMVNFVRVAMQHYSGVFQTSGVFPHQNSMGMAVNLLGPLFFAGYLQLGPKDRLGRLCTLAFPCTAVSGMWTYSRGAVALMPLGYALAAAGCWAGGKGKRRKIFARLLPIGLAGMVGLAAILPHLIERFVGAPTSSGETRVELANCAWEMIRAHPWAGVGINNWSLNMRPEHPYQALAGDKMGIELDYRGIVETVYLLVAAECGVPALLAMLAWFLWYWAVCARLTWKLRGTEWHFVAAGMLGGLTTNYLQSVLEWVLRQQMNMFLLMFCFALAAHLRERGRNRPGRRPIG